MTLPQCCLKRLEAFRHDTHAPAHVLLARQALCWCNRPLTEGDVAKLLAIKDLEVAQDTPVRVLHRRAPKVRCCAYFLIPDFLIPDSSLLPCCAGGRLVGQLAASSLFCGLDRNPALPQLHLAWCWC